MPRRSAAPSSRYMSSRPSATGRAVSPRPDREPDRPRRRRQGRARVLAIAAGHLREVELSAAVQQRTAARSSSRSIRTRRAWRSSPATTRASASGRVEGSVRQILAGKVNLGQFDFVYAAGLFDYLSAPVAAALTRRMFEMTKPGGIMLIPNFLGDAFAIAATWNRSWTGG